MVVKKIMGIQASFACLRMVRWIAIGKHIGLVVQIEKFEGVEVLGAFEESGKKLGLI